MKKLLIGFGCYAVVSTVSAIIMGAYTRKILNCILDEAEKANKCKNNDSDTVEIIVESEEES